MAYARSTSVSVERTRGEIEKLLTSRGAEKFAYTNSRTEADILFQMKGRFVRYRLIMPNPNDKAFVYTASRGYRRPAHEVERLWEQACRARWRALLLVIRAKLEAVEAGITTFEEEFLPFMLLPGGETVAQRALPEVERAYANGRVSECLLLEG